MTTSRGTRLSIVFAAAAASLVAISSVVLAAQGIVAGATLEDVNSAEGLVTTKVEQGVVSDTVAADFRVNPLWTQTVYGPDAGVFTREGVRGGIEIGPGSVIATVDERPVFAFEGAIPVYRALGPGMQGADVDQLQAALIALGYQIGRDRAMVYGEGTGQAVFAFVSERGFVPVDQNGSPIEYRPAAGIPQGEFVFLPSFPALATTQCGTRAQPLGESICDLTSASGEIQALVPATEADRVAEGMAVALRNGTTDTRSVLGPRVPIAPPPTVPDTGKESAADAAADAVVFSVVLEGEQTFPIGVRGSAEIEVAASSPSALRVESVAVRSTNDGQSWLDLVDGSRADVNVGLCAGGYCEVSGDGISAATEAVLSGEPGFDVQGE